MIKVAILGFGVVGSGVGEVIMMNNDKLARALGDGITVKYIFDKREFPGTPWQEKVVHDIDVIMNQSRRKRLISFDMKMVEIIAPVNDAQFSSQAAGQF